MKLSFAGVVPGRNLLQYGSQPPSDRSSAASGLKSRDPRHGQCCADLPGACAQALTTAGGLCGRSAFCSFMFFCASANRLLHGRCPPPPPPPPESLLPAFSDALFSSFWEEMLMQCCSSACLQPLPAMAIGQPHDGRSTPQVGLKLKQRVVFF